MPSRSRQFRQQAEHQASWDRLRDLPWSPLSDQRASGSGAQRIQLIHLPSFEKPSFWEVCEIDKQWVLYTAEVMLPSWKALMVQGYERVEVSSESLRGWYEQLCGLQLAVCPDQSEMAGADGVITQLALFGGLYSECRFQWWSTHPPQWDAMVEIATAMLDEFTLAAG